MSRAYEYLLEFKDRAVGNMKRLSAEAGILDRKTKAVGDEMSRTERKSRSLGNEMRRTESSGFGLGRMFGGLRGQIASYLTVAALLGGTSYLSKAASNFEQTTIAFETMLGSAERGSNTIRELNQFANVTPFTNDDVFKASKSLLAYNIQAEELIPTLTSLGNIAAGVGMDKMPQLVLAFGQVKAATRLTGMELRQFTEAGVPLLDELAKVTGKSVAVIKEDLIPSGKIGFDLVSTAMANMSKEGGKFFNLMERQSTTFGGRLSTLQGKIGLLAVEYGTGLNKTLRPAVEGALYATDQLLYSAKSLTDKYKDQVEKVDQLTHVSQPLIDKYRELTSKAKLNKDEQTELKTITEQLGEALPGIVTEWDKFGKALKISADEFSRFKGLQEDFLKQRNADAILEKRISLQSALIRGGSLYRDLNNEKKFDQNVFGLISKSYYEKHKDRILAGTRSDYRAIMGDESGHGEIGTLINELRELNGLRKLTAKEIAKFNGNNRDDFSGYRSLISQKFPPLADAGNGGTGKPTGGLSDDVNAGLDGITAGGTKSITINFQGGIKFAENIDISVAQLQQGLDQLEPQMREFFARLLQSGLHTGTGG